MNVIFVIMLVWALMSVVLGLFIGKVINLSSEENDHA